MARVVKLRLEGTGEVLPDGSMRVIGVLQLQPQAPVQPVPNVPQNLRLVSLTSSEAVLAWDASTGADTYELYRDDAELDDTATSPATDSTVSAGETYTYTVRARNEAGASGFSDPLVVEVPAAELPVPGTVELQLVELLFDEVTFGWGPLPNAVEYEVYDGETLLDTITGVIFTHSGLTAESEHSYTVVASNATGDGDPSDALEVTTPENLPPVWGSIPDQVVTVGQEVNLPISSECEDPEDRALSFSSGDLPAGLAISDGSIVGTPTSEGSSTSTVTASDGDNTADIEINWDVQSGTDTAGPSAPEISVQVSGSEVTVNIVTPSTDPSGVKNYQVWRSADGGATFALRRVRNLDEFPYIETGVPNGTYQYKVRARDLLENQGDYSSVSEVSVGVSPGVPDTPVNFVASVASATRIDLSWAAGPSGATPTDYDVDFSTVGPSGPWTALPVTGTGTTFSHTGLSQIQYWYRLRANVGENSSGYATATATPTGGTQAPAFVIAAGTKTFNCASAVDVNGTTRKVQPGEVVQIASRTPSTGILLTISNPQGTAAQPIRFVPPPNELCNFKRSAAQNGSFCLLIKGSATNPNLHGHVVLDGFTTSANVETDADTGLKHGFRFQTFNANDSADGWIKLKGFVQNVTMRYVHFDMEGRGGICIGTNDNAIDRTDFPGVFRGPYKVEYCKAKGSGALCYIGSNYQNSVHGPGMPISSVTLQYCWAERTTGTPYIFKNCWEGNCEIHHNIAKDCAVGVPGQTIVQKRGILASSCAGSIHHNWIENTALNAAGGAQSPNHALSIGTNEGPSSGGEPGYNNGNAYSSIRMKVYSNLVFIGPNIGINARDDAGTVKTWAEIFSNTVDNFADYGIQLQNVHANSFAENNVVTRCRPSGSQVQGVDASKNFLSGHRGDANSTLSGIFVNVGAKDYRLAAARAVTGGSVLGTNVAETDFGSAYIGSIPIPVNDATRVSVSGADMGAFER